MLVKIIHLDEPRCGSRMSKSDIDHWYRKSRYKEMEDELNEFMRSTSTQGYTIVDLKINWQSNTATVLYEAGMEFDSSKLFTKEESLTDNKDEWIERNR